MQVHSGKTKIEGRVPFLIRDYLNIYTEESTKTHGSLDIAMIIYIGEDRKKEKEKKGISKEFGILFGKCFKKR